MKRQAILLLLLVCWLSCSPTFALSTPPDRLPLVILSEEIRHLDLRAEALFYADQLAIDSSSVIRVVLSLQLEDDRAGIIQYQNADIGTKPHQFLIHLNKRNTFSQLSTTLAHEMVHAQQYVIGDLQKVDREDFIWKGERFRNVSRIRYLERPWEQDAIHRGMELRKAFLESAPCLP
ncbi:MAG: hypothetical protein AAGA85_00685 [Bacteroidota bacterium]